jgi:hypothetical protein
MASAASGPDPEALAWLRQSPPPFGVSLHKEVRPVAEGVQLVETLYALGAVRVTVPAWAIRLARPGWMPIGRQQVGRHQGGLITCGFEVELPEGGPDREALIWFIATESPQLPLRWGPGVPLQVFRSRVGCKTAVLAWV